MDWFKITMLGAVLTMTLIGACDSQNESPIPFPDTPLPTVLVVNQNPLGGGQIEGSELGGGSVRPLIFD